MRRRVKVSSDKDCIIVIKHQARQSTKSDIAQHSSSHQHGLSCKNFQRGKTDAQKLPQIAAAKSGAELKMTNFKYPNILFTQNIAVSAAAALRRRGVAVRFIFPDCQIFTPQIIPVPT